MLGLIGIRRHDRFRTLLSSYLDDQLTEVDAATIERHLSGCDECRLELVELKATVQLFRDLPVLEVPRSFALGRAPEPAPAPWSFQWVPTLATSVAGVLLAALIVGDAVGILSQNQQAEQTFDRTITAAATEAEDEPAAASATTFADEAAPAVPPAVPERAMASADTAAVEAPAPAPASAPITAQAAAAPKAAAETTEAQSSAILRAAPALAPTADAAPANALTEEAVADGAPEPAAKEPVEASAAPAAVADPAIEQEAALSDLQADTESVAPKAALAVEPALTEELETAPIPEASALGADDQAAPLSVALDETESEPDDGLALPLHQLELVLSVLLAVMAAVTIWTARRPHF